MSFQPGVTMSTKAVHTLRPKTSLLTQEDTILLQTHNLYQEVPLHDAADAIHNSIAETGTAFAFSSTSGCLEDEILATLREVRKQQEQTRKEQEQNRKDEEHRLVKLHLHNLVGTLDSFYSDFHRHINSHVSNSAAMFVSGCNSFTDFDKCTRTAVGPIAQQLMDAANGYAVAARLQGGLPTFWWRDAAVMLHENRLRNEEAHPLFTTSAEFVLNAAKQRPCPLPTSCETLLVATAKYASAKAPELEARRKTRLKEAKDALQRLSAFL